MEEVVINITAVGLDASLTQKRWKAYSWKHAFWAKSFSKHPNYAWDIKDHTANLLTLKKLIIRSLVWCLEIFCYGWIIWCEISNWIVNENWSLELVSGLIVGLNKLFKG